MDKKLSAFPDCKGKSNNLFILICYLISFGSDTFWPGSFAANYNGQDDHTRSCIHYPPHIYAQRALSQKTN